MHTATLTLFLVTLAVKCSKTNNVLNIPDVGRPLFLTPLLERNKIYEARRSAKVNPKLFYNFKSYSGLLTVDKRFNSNLFFWFFPAEEDYEHAPVLLWLQGGPGVTSLIGLFQENGPFYLRSSNKLELSPYSWTKNFSVIYIDNPVQTGYSFTIGGFAKNQTKIGEDLYEALKQFFIMFPELQNNDFYVQGESFGGKFVVAAAYIILKKNPSSNLKINLKGVTIGNGIVDPENQLEIHDNLYQLGLLDFNDREKFKEVEQKVIHYIRKKQFEKAFYLFDDLIKGKFNGANTLYEHLTGFIQYYNYLYPPTEFNLIVNFLNEFLQQKYIRKAIHVGHLRYNGGLEVRTNLINDYLDTVAPWISELLSQTRVLHYSGQLDIIAPYTTTVNLIRKLNFSAAEEYKTAPRHFWKAGNEVAWYVKQAGNLTEVLVRNSGHLVPADQPAWCLELISRFIRNEPLWNNE